jgi:putative hydrolase of the HAD superfamily
MADAEVDVVVFDLGGVLAEFGGVARMRALSGIDDDEELWRRWLTCDWVRRFERGTCTAEAFAAGVVADWELAVTAETFLAEFGQWLVGPLPGAEELVTQTRKAVPVAVLSNTNEVHWRAGAQSWPLLELFDRAFLSFEIGMVKPDREIFSHVVADLGTEPERVLFLDDNQMNVDQAREIGLQAARVVGVSQARDALVAAGVV